MERVRKILHNDHEVWLVNYSGQRGDDLIQTFEQARDAILEESKPVVILTIFDNKTFVNSHFVKHVQTNLPALEKITRRQAIIGVTSVQEWILKGINLWYATQVRPFSTMDEALAYLTGSDHEQGDL